MSLSNISLLYIADPLCSWCYGFAPEITKVMNDFSHFDLELVMGGLRPYGSETMDTLKDFLKGHWEHVQERSEMPFNFAILENASFVYDTEPPCRAVVAVRTIDRELSFAFFKKIQTAFYADNLNTNEVSTYLPIVKELGIDEVLFQALFFDNDTRKRTAADFERSRTLGINGFPSVILQNHEQLTLIARGYIQAEVLIARISQALNQSGS